MFLGVVVSLVASGDHDFVDVLGLVLVLVDVFLDACRSGLEMSTLLLMGEILMILSSDFTMSRFSMMPLKSASSEFPWTG